MRRFFLALFSTLLLTAMASTPLVSTGRAARFIDVDVHALVGGTLVTQNFASCFPSISELSVNMGPSYGIGFGASLNFNDFIGLGCEVNALLNYYKMTLAVADNEATSITNTFIRNHFFTANFPVFIRLKFNLGGNVRWIIDGGAYYTYGLGGRQKTTMYSAHVNELSQLITVTTSSRSPYYNSPRRLHLLELSRRHRPPSGNVAARVAPFQHRRPNPDRFQESGPPLQRRQDPQRPQYRISGHRRLPLLTRKPTRFCWFAFFLLCLQRHTNTKA